MIVNIIKTELRNNNNKRKNYQLYNDNQKVKKLKSLDEEIQISRLRNNNLKVKK